MTKPESEETADQRADEQYDVITVSPFQTDVRFGFDRSATQDTPDATAVVGGVSLEGPLDTVRLLTTHSLQITPSILADLAFVAELFVLHDKVGSLVLTRRYGGDFFELFVKDMSLTAEARSLPSEFRVPDELVTPHYADLWSALEQEGNALTFADNKLEYFKQLPNGRARRRMRRSILARCSVALAYGVQSAVCPTALLAGLRPPELRSLGYQFYRVVSERYQIEVERLSRLDRAYRIRVPPLLAILLQRCQGRGDLIATLGCLREEFAELRTEVSKLERELQGCLRVRDQIALIEQIDATREALTKRIAGRKNLTTSFLKRLWGTVERTGLFKAYKGDPTQLLTWDEQRGLVNRVIGYLDIWRLSTDVEKHFPLLNKVFGVENIDEKSFGKAFQVRPTS